MGGCILTLQREQMQRQVHTCDQQNTSGLRTTDPARERQPSFQLALRAGGCISGPRKMPI